MNHCSFFHPDHNTSSSISYYICMFVCVQVCRYLLSMQGWNLNSALEGWERQWQKERAENLSREEGKKWGNNQIGNKRVDYLALMVHQDKPIAFWWILHERVRLERMKGRTLAQPSCAYTFCRFNFTLFVRHSLNWNFSLGRQQKVKWLIRDLNARRTLMWG